ncbi:hypothetical protein [Oxalicibacterium faecigallinarum]|uniref:Uncharacterized protein n=1 Tax=Oxalicibacterium faecigallinarum TaxID=573741 RepID=A0A8J3AUP7_9BURK|nr:hypothetical protein [Oxalicibacterium faecigallinarum]GGI19162.1 hypothetical protein GCM10008066_17700 [Oxalicibacterium faecigallinarum]
MRFVPTSAVTVEKLKQLAKKTKAKFKIKHAEALDRVARGAGYNHWHHVLLCAEESLRRPDGQLPLLKECEAIVAAAQNGEGRLVVTGPEVLDRPLILFSTPDADAWILEPNEDRAICLLWRGQKFEPEIRDHGREVQIAWDGTFDLAGDAFLVDVDLPAVGQRLIYGYPLRKLRDALHHAKTVERLTDDLFFDRDTVPLTEQLIEELVVIGWDRDRLEEYAREGAEYSPQRNSFLTQVMTG